jgi:hypothetical protein
MSDQNRVMTVPLSTHCPIGRLVSMSDSAASAYVGQVECDPAGTLWAVLYCGDQVVQRQQVRSLRQGKRRVRNMVLAVADTFAADPPRPARVQLNRMPAERRASGRRRHRLPQLAAPR